MSNMRMTRRALMASMAAVGASLPISGARAQTKLKWGHVYETSEPYHKWALWAADEMKKRTNGAVEIQVFPASSIGKESDINEGLALGTVDIIYTGQLFAGRAHGPLALGGAPFMFRDFGHWQAFRKSDLFKDLADGYKKKTGHDIVSMTYYGERHVTSRTLITKPEDMKGMKIRVPDAPLYRMFPEAVGANPTPIAFAEVYLALSQGVVDAQENPLTTIQAKKFHEPNKFIALTGHIADALLTIVAQPTLARLKPAERDALMAILREAAENCTADIVKNEKELVAWFRSQGVTVTEVDRAPFRAAVAPRHLGPAATWDKATYDRLQAIRSVST
jgi:tripartite ATP-independent transporter DctP family solute receptor